VVLSNVVGLTCLLIGANVAGWLSSLHIGSCLFNIMC